MNTWGSECIAPPLLVLAVDGGELSASPTGRFTPGRGNTHQYPLYRRLGGSQSWSRSYGIGEKIFHLCRESNRGPALCHYTN
jgi:hypothetical protein